MSYQQPEIRDYGDLLDITAAAGAIGTEDGAGKAVHVQVDPLVQATVQVLP